MSNHGESAVGQGRGGPGPNLSVTRAERGPELRTGALLAPDPTLECLPAPAAILDAALTLRKANRAFLRLCPGAQAGARLVDLLVPQGGEACVGPEVASFCYRAYAAGQEVEVRGARREGGVGVLVGASEAAFHLGLSPEPAHEALLELSREVALAANEDELVGVIARCIRSVFPGRSFCVRVVEPNGCALSSLYAEGSLLPSAREKLALRRAAVEAAGLDLHRVPAERLELTEAEPAIFQGCAGSLSVALAAAGELFGALHLECRPGPAAERDRDEKLLMQLANQAAVGVRNAKLIGELTLVKRQLESIIEGANALIIAVGRRREVLVFNRALEELTGLRRAEVLGRDILQLVSPEDRPPVVAMLEAALRGETVSRQELPIRLANGKRLRVAFSAAALQRPGGEVEGTIVIAHDLSRQRELERRVVQAEKLASLGQLAAGVAHEINNPLSTITLYSEALLQSAPLWGIPPAEVEKLRRIHESALRILRFARDLTSYARPAQDEPQELDVHAVLDQAVRYCEHTFRQSRAALVRCYGSGLPAIRGVRSSLVQVFVNLLTNACHALPETGGKVELITRAQARAVEVEVLDTGVGIEPEHLPHLFEPFFTTKRHGAGTGLGLTIVQNIVTKHGGTVQVRSEVGKGTAFTVRLPVSGA